jgi:transglutaminase-like putative cysteine protease
MRRWWELPEGWLTPVLLLALVLTACGSLQGAAWHAALQRALAITTPAAVVGLVLGFLLAWIRRIPRVVAHIVGSLAGVALVVQLSGTLRSVILPTTGQSLPFLDPALQGWKDLATELLIRGVILWRTFVRGASGEDIVLFIVLLTWVSWLIGFLSAWFAIRSHWPALAVGFPGLVLLLNTFYAPRVPLGYFGFYLFVTLVFLVYYFWKQREVAWRKDKVRYPPEMSRGVLWAGILLSVVLVLGTSFLPTTAGGAAEGSFWGRFIQPWREVRTTWERLFSNVSGDYDPKVRLGEFSPRFGLSGARTASEGVAFVVRSNRSDYLRALTFDQYTGHGWNSPSELGPVWVMDENRLPMSQSGRIIVSQEITPYLQGGNIVFGYAEPVSTNLPAIVELSADPHGGDQLPDIVAVRTRSSLAEERPYTVVSYVSAIDKTSLRQAGLSYPTIITDRYLQLPSELSPRVYELADRIVAQELAATLPPTATGDITLQPARSGGPSVVVRVEGGQIVSVSPSGGLIRAGLVSPYDAAEAVEEYLRTQYTYREDISTPPSNIDAVDYFLFESKAGYCDYFASAMAVLMRTQGVPARLVRGYAGGYYDEDLAAYVVPARVAHSWVEVYFPIYGWQRFEPTAADYTSRPRRAEAPAPRTTPLSRTPVPDDEIDDRRPPRDLEMDPLQPGTTIDAAAQKHFPWAAVGIPGGLVMLGALFVGVLAFRANRGLRELDPAAATYERMCRWADTIRLVPPNEQTPYEISDHLSDALTTRRAQLARITSAYVYERFGQRELPQADIDGVHQSWHDLRWTLWSFPWQRVWTAVRQMWAHLRERVANLFQERPVYY